jgi:predicted metal-binding membrane protein
MGTGSVESALLRDRTIVGVALVGIILLSWAYILAGAGMGMSPLHMSGFPTAMPMSDPMAAMQPVPWTAGYALLVFAMWWLMMVAMMLPSAAPMIFLFAAVTRKRNRVGEPYMDTGLFVAGYLTVWGAFGVLAVTLQWQLDRIVLLSPMMVTTSVVLGGLLLVGAGLWQFTPLKHACLRYCRSPLTFLSRHWRDGPIGAFRMGVRHGTYCLGCCWMLMLVLFYGGIMNIYWIAGLAVLILVEKMTPPGPRVGSLIGVIFMAWGALLLAGLI